MGNICQQKEDIGTFYFTIKIIKASTPIIIKASTPDLTQDHNLQDKEAQAKMAHGTIIPIKDGVITQTATKDGVIIDNLYFVKLSDLIINFFFNKNIYSKF